MCMCTVEKKGNLFILTLTGEDEHRLNPTRIDAIRSALNRIRSDSTSHSCSALITSAQGKFFSNGYDLAWAGSSPDKIRLMSSKLRALVADLISFPMPTIAAVTGHACAGGFILAFSHDYVVMRKDRGFLYMSEMDIGLKIPAWFMALISCKIGDPVVRREVVLKAKKLTAEQGVKRGIVDAAYDSAEETVKGAIELGEKLTQKGWNKQVYSENRKQLYKEILDQLGVDETTDDLNKVSIAASKL
ncbi:Carnitine racemase, putative isoform 1 [Theobroma cacao]|uniref:Delta(3)-Delta(2)-enoyl-CoA isomerase n=1 Tax=Theobroma cacao TaxID=3641 RepID=A0A061FNJ6_THECC|nr:Carnitine racemase, putative isoform 1 [Theobroma cacao]EOY18215.1 Carnitine racemase, putative isoform 1 [Theobroma cacao]EOY18216.1 Carnitine racemase, putative isoform 1 [Theobroma cacao]EOY18217.1 Carnitine racemase, putative isoform 1 [Theobroma cacao]EOY18218.1 Carnitine racemase, putative isoform 1 [Theobroma cacao]